MVSLATLLLIAIVIVASVCGEANAQTAAVDRSASAALTGYLREHHLPLVGASVSKSSDGSTHVMLYGYVATEKGKLNAGARAAKYFNNDPRVVMLNRIAVNPEIRNLSAGSNSASKTADSGGYAMPAYPSSTGTLTWDQVYREIQQGGIHPAPDPADSGTSN